MRKVGLFLEAEPHFGGTFQYNQTMLAAVAALARERFAVVVAYTSDAWLPHLAHYDFATIKVERGFWGRALGLFWVLSRLPMGWWRWLCPTFHPMAKALLRQHCDLWIFPAQDARSFQIPVPALVTILDLVHRYGRAFPEGASRWQRFNREPVYRNICRWAKGVLVVSEVDRQQVVAAYAVPAERVFSLPMVAPSYMYENFLHFAPPGEAGESGELAATVREESGPEPVAPWQQRLPSKFFFYPAQFWWHKNHHNLLRALARLKPELPDLRLVLAGGPKNAYGPVLALIKELQLEGSVLLLGYVPDAFLPELYRRAQALVMPTYYGPTNLPPLEALVAGCPMALSRNTAMPERVGDAALVFDPDSVVEIADCLRKLWLDDQLCAALRAKGQARAGWWQQADFNRRLEEIVERLTNS